MQSEQPSLEGGKSTSERKCDDVEDNCIAKQVGLRVSPQKRPATPETPISTFTVRDMKTLAKRSEEIHYTLPCPSLMVDSGWCFYW
jgi:hypothetical protein